VIASVGRHFPLDAPPSHVQRVNRLCDPGTQSAWVHFIGPGEVVEKTPCDKLSEEYQASTSVSVQHAREQACRHKLLQSRPEGAPCSRAGRGRRQQHAHRATALNVDAPGHRAARHAQPVLCHAWLQHKSWLTTAAMLWSAATAHRKCKARRPASTCARHGPHRAGGHPHAARRLEDGSRQRATMAHGGARRSPARRCRLSSASRRPEGRCGCRGHSMERRAACRRG